MAVHNEIIEFIDTDDTEDRTLIKVTNKKLTNEMISTIKDSINEYKTENAGEWNIPDCIQIAYEQLEANGYVITCVPPIRKIWL